MSVQEPFSMHRQSVWMQRASDRAANPSLPLWVRVGFLALACHRANGHANFKPGEIAEILGKPGQPLTPAHVSKEIRLAKQAEWIMPESNARCLVVPPTAAWGGLGHVNDNCPVHNVKKKHLPKVVGVNSRS
jgi:hypothetical protein